MSRKNVWNFFRQNYSTSRLHLYINLLIFQIVFYTGLIKLAVPVLEHQQITWLESLLFVLQTMTTVGYDLETFFPITNQITITIIILIIATGVFTVLMIIPAVIAPYIQDALEATPPGKTAHKLDGHVVIIGYGELTKALIESLMISNLDLVIVEENKTTARALVKKYRRHVHIVWGDYGEQSTWTGAWVQNASNVIVCEAERTTAMIILGIREMTDAQIISAVDDLSFDRYLRYAGSEYILSPKNSTGKILALHAVLCPEADTIYETISLDPTKYHKNRPDNSLKLIKVPIMEGCHCTGKTIGDLDLFERYGVEVLFFWKNGAFVLKPRITDIIDTSSMLFLLGRAKVLREVVEKEFQTDTSGEELAVIAGFGDVGRATYNKLIQTGINCVVVDPDAAVVPPYGVVGKAEDESVLKEAHIEDSRVCIVAVNDDNVNIFTTLIARNINPSLHIIARANEASSIDKLYRAGADYVALLPAIGGQVIAGIVLADIVRILLDLPNGQMVVMKHIMKNVPTTVGWIEMKSGVTILGIEGEIHTVVKPAHDEPLIEGDAVIAVGDKSALKRFICLL